jgi:hypothetical protein
VASKALEKIASSGFLMAETMFSATEPIPLPPRQTLPMAAREGFS